MYTLIFLVITTSRADGDIRENQNVNLNNVKHVQQITGLVIARAVPFAVPQPYSVTVEQEVPYAVKVPVGVPVDRPFEVHIPKPFSIPVIRPVPYPVHRIVPYPVHTPAKSHEDRPTTSTSHISEFQRKPLDISTHLDYDVAAFTRQVPVRSAQPSSPPPQSSSFPSASTTSDTTPSSLNFNVLDSVRFPVKATDPVPAISFQSQRPFSGFNLGSHFNEQQFQANPTEQNHQQQQLAPLVRRPLAGFNSDSAIFASYHQQNSEQEHSNSAGGSSNLSQEQKSDLIANFEGTVFNLNNRLRRQSGSRSARSTTPKPNKKT